MATENARRVLLTSAPFHPDSKIPEWNRRGEWPARWITCEGADQPFLVTAYKLRFDLPESRRVLFHVTADERYRLFLNGEEIGSGSERGDTEHWFFETYEVTIPAGSNLLVAQAWSLGNGRAFAQMSLKHGFLLCPDDSELVQTFATGVADWKVKKLPGYRFANPESAWGTGFNVILKGESIAWDFEKGVGEDWQDATIGDIAVGRQGNNDKDPRHLLTPAMLPAMADPYWTKARVRHVSFPAPGSTSAVPFRAEENLEEELMDWTRLIIGNPIVVPPYSRRRVLLDLHDYVCAYPEIVVSKGRHGEIRVNWQEALFEKYGHPEKGNRDEILDKFFCTIYGWEEGIGDTFVPDGGTNRKFTTLWWQAGRFVELLIQTDLEELVIESLKFREDRYPFENQLKFEASDERLAQVGKLAFRTLQMCSHETYMDCPFYEQLQYIGDTRLQVLVSYIASGDDRLARKALKLFDYSRQIDGITQSRYPSRVIQVIPPFALWWVCMIWDFALWRGDKAFVQSLAPGARIVLDWFRDHKGSLDLVEAPTGWNFVDWVPGWHGGMPTGADDGVSSILNRQFEIALRKMAQVESWLGEPEMAERHQRTASEIAAAIHRSFWNNKRAMYADDLAHSSYSEHAQVLSILTEALPEKIERMVAQGLLTDQELHRTTVYFAHYLFEALAHLGRTDLILDRMSLWFDHLQLGLATIVEQPEPTRSDCHAWGAHPLYHYVASFLGARPTTLGGKHLEIKPNIGELKFAEASFPYMGERVSIKARQEDNGLELEIELPEGVTATVSKGGRQPDLLAGRHELRFD